MYHRQLCQPHPPSSCTWPPATTAHLLPSLLQSLSPALPAPPQHLLLQQPGTNSNRSSQQGEVNSQPVQEQFCKALAAMATTKVVMTASTVAAGAAQAVSGVQEGVLGPSTLGEAGTGRLHGPALTPTRQALHLSRYSRTCGHELLQQGCYHCRLAVGSGNLITTTSINMLLLGAQQSSCNSRVGQEWS
jgi:hypothetical protein